MCIHMTPAIRLQNARVCLDSALEACPHWDLECDGTTDHDCCHRVDEARKEKLAALKALRSAETPKPTRR